MPRTLLPLVVLSTVVACRPSAPTEPETQAAPVIEETPQAPDEGSGDPVPAEVTDEELVNPRRAFAVHEWGLVRVSASGTELATSGFGTGALGTVPHGGEALPGSPSIGAFGKPLIYFHALPGFDPSTPITLTVGIAGGTLHEVWPSDGTPSSPESHTFGPLRVDPDLGCGTDNVPAEASPFCDTVTAEGGVCETGELHQYLEMVDHCLQTPHGPAPVLLYNGLGAFDPAPLEVARGEALTVTNPSSYPIGPAWIALGEGAQGRSGGHDPQRLFVHVPTLLPGATVTVGPEGAIPFEDVSKALDEALIHRGLTSTEVGHFLAAWAPDVLRPEATWQAIGLTSQEAADAALPLTITPAPTERVRAIVFVVE